MKRLLTRSFLVAALIAFLPALAPAQNESPADRAAARAAGRAERDRERAERAQERVEERARRAQERDERRLERRYDRDGAHIVFAQSYNLPEGSTTSEDIVVIGGNATIDGHAENDVTVVGGSLRIGPKAVIDGDVSVVGGALDRDPAAQIAGGTDVAHISLPHWSWAWGWPVAPGWDQWWWAGAAVAFTIGRIVLVLFISMLLVAIAPRWTTSIAGRLATAPVVSTVAGFVAEILFAPALIVLAVMLIITIVGIPLLAGLPLLVAAFAVTWVAGYAAVAGLLGARLRGSDWYVNGLRPLDVFLGSCLLSGLTLFGQALMMAPAWMAPVAVLLRGTGWAIEYLAWTVALGAALTAWARPGRFDTGAVPPVVPPLPTPSPTAM